MIINIVIIAALLVFLYLVYFAFRSGRSNTRNEGFQNQLSQTTRVHRLRLYLDAYTLKNLFPFLTLITIVFIVSVTNAFKYVTLYHGDPDCGIKKSTCKFLTLSIDDRDFCAPCEERCNADTCIVKIDKYIKPAFSVAQGDIIRVIPLNDSKLFMGRFLTFFIGPFEPSGRKKGILNTPLDDYNHVREFPHGAMLLKYPGVVEWIEVKNGLIFKTEGKGTLEFEINDRILSDNRFFQCVKIIREDHFD